MVILSLLLALVAQANPQPASPEPNFRFQYMPNEGDGSLECTHKRIRDLPDWEVDCGGKMFAAHVVIRHFHRAQQSSIEILYWITERGSNARSTRQFHSTSAWVHLSKPGDAARLSLAQGVENDYASLVLDWKADER